MDSANNKVFLGKILCLVETKKWNGTWHWSKGNIYVKGWKIENNNQTIFHLWDRLEAADCQYMFQSLVKVEEFFRTKLFAYIKTYLEIWYPFFKQGIKNSQQNAIQSVRPLTAYFSRKTAISKSKIPPKFTFCYDGLKRDATRKKRKRKM